MIEDRFEDYIVEGKLGDGGLATVYRVRHAETGEPFALKVLDRPSEVDVERLRREARIQGQVLHPNVVAVHRILTHDGTFALVMDLVEGPTLDRYLLEHGPLPVDEIRDLADGMLAGLEAVHRHGVVHRDLKPSNILLQRVGASLVPRLTDFGMVRTMQDSDTRLTERYATLGTPMYAAPEQLLNSHDIEQSADVYAMGCVLFEMASGHPPVQVRGLVDLFEKVTTGNRQHVQHAAPDLPEPMQRCIERCLSLEPFGRYRDAGELRRAWLGFSRPPPSSIPPYQPFEEFRGPARAYHSDPGCASTTDWDDGPSWQETSWHDLARLTKRDGRRELVETLERRLPAGRTRFQQRLMRVLAMLVVFGGFGLLLATVLVAILVATAAAWRLLA